MKKARFHLGDILSVTTGRLVSPSGIDGVYKILNFMTRDNLFTHQLPRAYKECRPYLERQYPQFAESALVDELNDLKTKIQPQMDNAMRMPIICEWLDDLVEIHGEYFEVEEIPLDDHTIKNPVDELVEMVGSDRVIVVDMEGDS